MLVRPGSCHGVEIHELARVLNHRVPFRRAKSRVRILERLERQLTQTSIRRLRSIGARSANVLHVTRDAWDLPYQGNVVGAPPPQGFIRFEACSRNPLGQALHHRQASLSVPMRLVVPELPLVALRAVDNYLVVNRQPGCPAALVLSRDTGRTRRTGAGSRRPASTRTRRSGFRRSNRARNGRCCCSCPNRDRDPQRSSLDGCARLCPAKYDVPVLPAYEDSVSRARRNRRPARETAAETIARRAFGLTTASPTPRPHRDGGRGDRADNAETLATCSSRSGERARTSRDLRLVRLEGAQHLLFFPRGHVEVVKRAG